MSNPTTSPLSGILPNACPFPEVVNGWTRETPWIDSDAGNQCGDYAVGPALVVYYEKRLPDGKVLGIETVTYFEVRPDEAGDEFPSAETFITSRDFFHSASSPERFEEQHFDVEDYEYNPLDFYRQTRLVDGQVTPEDAWWLLRTMDVDDRDVLLWEGEPIRR